MGSHHRYTLSAFCFEFKLELDEDEDDIAFPDVWKYPAMPHMAPVDQEVVVYYKNWNIAKTSRAISVTKYGYPASLYN